MTFEAERAVLHMNTLKRTICLLLSLALMLGLMPNVFAAQPAFIDVPAGMYYSAPVAWAVENGITNGTGANTFSPDAICSRGQVVTFLWRAQGSPEPATTVNQFVDAVPGSYYYKAMLWAVESGITTGTGNGKFSPDMSCNRDQVVTFLWRAQGKPAPASNVNPFSDVPAGSYYYDAVLWAVEQGITTGTGNGSTFSPGMSCSRGQIVTFLQRAIEPAEPVDPPKPPAEPLRFDVQPQSAALEAGNTVTLSVRVSGGTAPYTYQWSTGGTPIPGATATTYTTDAAGSYTCIVTDAAGSSLISSAAVITVTVPAGGKLTVTQQPVGAEIAKGSATTLMVAVDGGTKPYSYQWYKDGTPVAGATFMSYVAAQAGKYFCAIYDATGFSVISSTATVTVESERFDIHYDLYGNDSYLKKAGVSNPNPEYYESEKGLKLINLSADGYKFDGWYDGSGSNATQVKEISASETGDKYLYAHWTPVEYTVQFKSSLYLEEDETSYTVNKGVVLPTPKLSNYVFAGWSDEDGNVYSNATIPAGTTGDLTLTANWTSERNKTWAKPELDEPVIHVDEEAGVILFAYEIGKIENVPLYTIKDFGYIAGDGITKTEETSYEMVTTEEHIEAYAKSVAQATTESSDWTTSSTWNNVISVNEEWCEENEKKVEEAETYAQSDTGNWNISSGRSGSVERSRLTTNQDGWSNEVKINSSHSKTETDKETSNSAWNVNAKVSYTPKSASVGIGPISASTGGGFGGEIGGGYEHSWGEEHTESETTQSGMEISGSMDHSTTKTNSATRNASWNSEASFGGSSTTSSTRSSSLALTEKLSKKTGYGESYSEGGEDSTSMGHSSTESTSDEYSASVAYSTQVGKKITSSWTTQATKPGYHRWVVAGTAHVFAVVGYDMKTDAYFVYTQSIMDEKTHEFEDYSYTTAEYNDEENGVLPFEVPYEVAEYVTEYVSWTKGLKVDQNTGIITGYTGTDNYVVIPEYMNVGNGDVVKITGISDTAFRGNTNIVGISLSDFITEIPAYAFEGCTSLVGVSGGNITKIGKYAFSGCVSAEDIGIRSKVTELGERAFEGVDRIIVNAPNADVATSAMNCGANKIILRTEYLADGADSLKSTVLSVPEGTKYFEFNGNGQTYKDLTIVSGADATSINKTHFNSTGRIPLQISSPELVLNQVSVHASGIAMVLSADCTRLGLQATVPVSTDGENAILARDLVLYEINEAVVGKLDVSGELLVCDDPEGRELLVKGKYTVIDEDTFEKMLYSYTLYFDANGGECSETSREVANSTAIGKLPVPTRDYHNFDGWYLGDGTKVSETTVFSTGLDQTVYAHWTLKPLSGWVLASELPENAQAVTEKWSYTKTTNTESRETSLAGYTQTGSYWVKSATGSKYYSTSFPSGFDQNHSLYSSITKSAYTTSETATTKREVSNSFAGYVYWHWMYDCGGANAYNRRIFYQKGYNSENGYGYNNFSAFTSTKNYGTVNHEGQSGWTWYLIQDTHTSYAQSGGSYYWYRFNYYTSTYTDYYKMFQYQKVEELESITAVTPDDTISNVQKWVQYREK